MPVVRQSLRAGTGLCAIRGFRGRPVNPAIRSAQPIRHADLYSHRCFQPIRGASIHLWSGLPSGTGSDRVGVDRVRDASLRRAGATAGPLNRTIYPEPPLGRPSPIDFAPAESQPQPLPPLEESNPILWKERYAGRTGPLPLLDAPTRWFAALITAIAIVSSVTGGWLLVTRTVRALDPGEAERLAQRGPEPPDLGGAALIVAGTLAAGLYLLPLTVGVSGCVAGERQRGTLDSLLATPLSRWSILWSKLRARTESGLVFGVGAITGIGCGFGADGGTRLGLAAMAATAAGFLLTIAFTAWLSVRCDSAVRAFRLALPVLVLVIGLPVLIRNLIRWNDLNPSIIMFEYAAGFCVVVALAAWWRACRDSSADRLRLIPVDRANRDRAHGGSRPRAPASASPRRAGSRH